MKRAIFTFTILIASFSSAVHAQTQLPPVWAWSYEHWLVSALTGESSHYHTAVRPALKASEPVQTFLDVDVFGIQQLDSKDQQFSCLSTFRLNWQDDRLRWDPDVYGGIEVISVKAGMIWHPVLKVLNALEPIDLINSNTEALVSSEGAVHIGNTFITSTQCYLVQESVPFDRQKCTFLIGTANVPSTFLEVSGSVPKVPRQKVQVITNWVLESSAVTSGLSSSCIGPEGSACLRSAQVYVAVTMRRQGIFYIYTVMVPCALLTVIASTMFWVPHESGEKLSLGLSIFFGFVIFQLVVQESLAESGNCTPSILMRYVLLNFILVGVSVMVSVGSLAIYHRGSLDKDGGISSPNSHGVSTCQPSYWKRQSHDTTMKDAFLNKPLDSGKKTDKKCKQKGKTTPRDWKKIAVVMDRVMFVAYSLVFVSITAVVAVEMNRARLRGGQFNDTISCDSYST